MYVISVGQHGLGEKRGLPVFPFWAPTECTILRETDNDYIIDVENGHNTPWTRSKCEVFDTEEKAQEFADQKNQKMYDDVKQLWDSISSVQPMTEGGKDGHILPTR